MDGAMRAKSSIKLTRSSRPSCSTGTTSGSPCPWAWQVSRTPRTAHSQEELRAPADNALAEAQRRGGNHVTLASIRFEPKQ